ncbi:MAG: hypothetical protein MAG794_00666 [Gammaproteobacteria bacterium]|nr:hypothetical protein [Gammaproteobacteria bacterium]
MTHSNPWRWLAVSSLLFVQIFAHLLPAQSDRTTPGLIRLAEAKSTSIETGYTQAAGQLDPTDFYRLALLKIKGHLSVARALLQVRAPGADYHLREPIRSIFKRVQPQLGDRNAPFTNDVLVQLERATETTPQAALVTIDSAAAAIDGSFAQTGPMTARSALSLSEVLLRKAVQRYADSVSNNEVVDLRGYQTGRGFVIQAEALVRHASGVRGQPGHDTLLLAVVLIRQAWPGIRPPPIVFDPQSIAGRLDEAVAAMDVSSQ